MFLTRVGVEGEHAQVHRDRVRSVGELFVVIVGSRGFRGTLERSPLGSRKRQAAARRLAPGAAGARRRGRDVVIMVPTAGTGTGTSTHTGGGSRAFGVREGVYLRAERDVDVGQTLSDDVFEPLDPCPGGACEAVKRSGPSARNLP